MKHYQMQLSHFLKGYLKSAQLRNQKYSMRSFANKLNMNSGNLSQIIAGKRQVSREKAMCILNTLQVEENDLNKIMYSDSSDNENFIFDHYFKNFSSYKIINNHELDQLLSSDLYFKVRAISDTVEFQLNAEWICGKLKAEKSQVELVLKYLVENGDIDPSKNSQAIKHYYQSTDCKTNNTIRKYHRASLKEAIDKIEDLPTEKRDLTSTVFACNKENYEKAQKLIRSFHKQLVSLMATGNKDAIYKLNVQLYPCSEEENNK